MFLFGDFTLDPRERRLSQRGRAVELGARALDLLVVLADSAGRLVTKDELLDRVWPDVIVEEANLHVQMTAIRKAIGREAIRTVPGRGYQMVTPVRTAAPPLHAVPPAVAPPGLPPLHGRERELADLERLLDDGSLVTVTGAGGSGKTLLARHLVVRRATWRPAGSAWVDLLDVTDTVAVPSAVAAALGLPAGAASASALAKALRGLDVLLVLDNAEHLIGAVADAVTEIRTAAPEVRLLVTSQASLGVPDERVLALKGLSVPPRGCSPQVALQHAAITVFVDRARAVDRRFRLDAATVDDAVALCDALDGSALGIQLAASLLAMQPLADVRRRLVRDAVDANSSAVDPASNVLRSALAWSHGLLDEPARRVFRRLAIAVGALPLSLAIALVADEELDTTAAADALADLVDRSLVEPETQDGEVEPRYRLLDAPRAVALEALRDSGEYEAMPGRMAAVLGAAANEPIEPRFRALSQADVRVALTWALDHAPEAAVAIARTWLSPQLPVAERVPLIERLQANVPVLPPRLAGEALLSIGKLLGDTALARRRDLSLEAARHFRDAGDREGEYEALTRAAESSALMGDPSAAGPLLQQALALEDPTWPPRLLWVGAYVAAIHAGALDDPNAAMQAWERVLEVEEAGGMRRVPTLASMADVQLQLGDTQTAEAHLREAEALCRSGRRMSDLFAFVLANLCAARIAMDDLPGARAAASEGWPQAERFGATAWWADHLALLAAREGRVRSAAGLLGLADAEYERLSDRRQWLEQRHAEAAADLATQSLGATSFDAVRQAGAQATHAVALRERALSTQDWNFVA